MSASTPAEPMPRAKRGDLAVIVSRARSTALQGDGRECLNITLGRVSGITRAGVVTRYKEPMFSAAEEREQKVSPREQVQIMAADAVDIEGVLAQYRTHTWGETTGAGGDMIRPFASMDEVRQLIRSHLKSQ